MTDSTGASPEPTLADVMAVMQAGFAQLSTALATTNANLEAQNRALAALASKTAFIEAGQNALTNSMAETRGETRAAFQAVGRDMGKLGEAVGLVREDIAGVKSEMAFVEGFNRDMHEALVRHIADPDAHRPNAA